MPDWDLTAQGFRIFHSHFLHKVQKNHLLGEDDGTPDRESEAGDLKKLYRELCLRYHPDRIGTHDAKTQRLWNEIQDAYMNHDLEGLRAIHSGIELESGKTELSCSEIDEMIFDLEWSIQDKRSELRAQKKTPIWGFASWTEQKRKQIAKEIKSEFDQNAQMTSESDNVDAFFTGKPLVGELGYAFLFRNYRPEQGKWQTADPLGYPDGWNNLAYVNNAVIDRIDFLGAWGADVHTAINTALAGNEDEIEWNGKKINTIGELDDGSDAVDSLYNQAFGDEFEHGMRAKGQTVAQAQTAWNKFINDCVNEARKLSDKGREDNV